MLQALSNSALSLLMVATLLWGGCISCPQFFMFPKAEKSCCRKDGQCEKPTKTAPTKECKRLPVEPQGYASLHIELAAAAIPDGAAIVPVLEASSVGLHPEAPVSEHSPPDLIVLHSTFII